MDKDRQWAKNQRQNQPEPDFLPGNIHRFDLLLIFYFLCKVVIEIQVCGITKFYTWKSQQETEWASISMDQRALGGAHSCRKEVREISPPLPMFPRRHGPGDSGLPGVTVVHLHSGRWRWSDLCSHVAQSFPKLAAP